MVDPTSSNAVLANLGAGLGFGSETAGLEYGFIGNMLGVGDWATATPASLLATTNTTSTTTNNSNNMSHNTINNATQAMHLASNSNNTMPTPLSSQQQAFSTTTTTTAQHQYLPSVFPMSAAVSIAPGANPLANEETNNTTSFNNNNRPTTTSPSNSSPSSMRTQRYHPERKVCRPFNYAEGFHYLIEYVKEK